ncbi:N-acyl-D-glucosamine 2-epimerase [Bremerella cremea]|nr:N-acyl-D-glucosamine 2-epimerase [Bremerella cremea]
MTALHSSFTLMGEVESPDPAEAMFSLRLLSGEVVSIAVSRTTYYEVIRNIGDEWRDRVGEPDANVVEAKIGSRSGAPDEAMWTAKRQLLKYLKPGHMVCIEGVCSSQRNVAQYYARRIVLMHSVQGLFAWEDTHWWLQQINTLFEQWLDVLFKERRDITENDFSAFYRTNLDLLGGATGDAVQESATLSRFLYGLSSAYLLTGNMRALSAARACAKHLVGAYASPTHDGECVVWKFGRVNDGRSTKEILGSLNPEDHGSFPLYEQIYVLSGLAQYYRVTQDTWVMGYIVRTVAAFERFYRDTRRDGDPCFTGQGGYFSHIDPVTMRPDSPSLDVYREGARYDNRAKKNWNSIGDHIPAYLINLLAAIDPIPVSGHECEWVKLRDRCRDMLDECVLCILDHFAPDNGSKLVNERFHKDWSPDHTWGWQQNRGIVGHNLKISWNLTRCGNYYVSRAKQANEDGDTQSSDKYHKLAERCYEFARVLGHNMEEVGVDLARGGIFDALERNPSSGMPTEFCWGSTKDFWQQEQAILAYYIMQGCTEDEAEKAKFLKLARFCTAFWSLFFVDQDNRKIHFRTDECGRTLIQGQYAQQAGHAIAGYHAFELNYLAHLYIRTFVERGKGRNDAFVLYYRPVKNSSLQSLNVLPDFFRPSDLKIVNVRINGLVVPVADPHKFQIDISQWPEDSVIMVEYLPTGRADAQAEADLRDDASEMGGLDIGFDFVSL